jgi:MFS transporter, DHA1 family, inner membrane transport protein
MRGRSVAALLALSASTFIYVTSETLPIGLLPQIAAGLHTSPSAVGLLVTGYGLVVVLASVPLTQLTRRIPRRYLLTGLLAAFAAATAASAAAPDYRILFTARVAAALSQALFWSVVVPAAAGVVPARLRGRAVAVVFAGSSLAAVLGVPAGTWLGQRVGWRIALLAMAGLALATALAVATLVPTAQPEAGSAARGSAPDARRYWAVLAATVLAVTGGFTAFTYVTPFLTGVSAFSLAAIGPLLLARGVSGVVGVAAGGRLADRNPWLAMLAPIVLQAVSLLGLFAFGAIPAAAAVLVALAGLAISALSTTLGTRVLQTAPGSADLAAAGASTAFNVGITAGALLGGVLLPGFGVRSTALAGGLLSLAAVAVVLAEPRLVRRSAPVLVVPSGLSTKDYLVPDRSRTAARVPARSR